MVSDLSAGQIIGFTIGVYENDEGDPHEQIAQLARKSMSRVPIMKFSTT